MSRRDRCVAPQDSLALMEREPPLPQHDHTFNNIVVPTTQHIISSAGSSILPSVDGLQFNGIEVEGDVADSSTNEREER